MQLQIAPNSATDSRHTSTIKNIFLSVKFFLRAISFYYSNYPLFGGQFAKTTVHLMAFWKRGKKTLMVFSIPWRSQRHDNPEHANPDSMPSPLSNLNSPFNRLSVRWLLIILSESEIETISRTDNKQWRCSGCLKNTQR